MSNFCSVIELNGLNDLSFVTLIVSKREALWSIRESLHILEMMRVRAILILFGLFLSGCGSNNVNLFGITKFGGNGDGAVNAQIACPSVDYLTKVTINYTAQAPLPQYLAVAINGEPNGFDACVANTSAEPAISVQASGVSAKISILIQADAKLYNSYFSPSSQAPVRGDIGLQLYGRNSCSDALTLIASDPGLAVPWQPAIPFGSACGVYGYTASVTAN